MADPIEPILTLIKTRPLPRLTALQRVASDNPGYDPTHPLTAQEWHDQNSHAVCTNNGTVVTLWPDDEGCTVTDFTLVTEPEDTGTNTKELANGVMNFTFTGTHRHLFADDFFRSFLDKKRRRPDD